MFLFSMSIPVWPNVVNLEELYICGYSDSETIQEQHFPALRRLGVSVKSRKKCFYKLRQVVAPNLAHLHIWPSNGVTPLFEDPIADPELTALLRRQYPQLQWVNEVAFPAEP